MRVTLDREQHPAAFAGLLALAVGIAFLPALGNGFTGWDDDVYITANPLLRDLSPAGLVAILTTPVSGNWHPLTILTLAIEHRLLGPGPTVHLAVNLLLHLGACLLAGRLFVALGLPRWVALGAVLLWGVHPGRVEAVAWIPGRKDLLATVFSLAALLAWVGRHEGRERARRLLALGAFAGALLSKGTAVTLPLVMVLADRVRGGRLDRRALAGIAPFVLLAVPAAWAAVAARSSYQGVLQEVSPGVAEELGLGLHRLVWYHLARIAVPLPLDTLNPFYSRPGAWFPDWPRLAGAAAVLLATGAGTALLARRRPEAAFGPVLSLATIAPSLAVPIVGHTADRFAYLPALGVFHFAGVLLALPRSRTARRVAAGAVAVAALALAALARAECRSWRDARAVWGRAVALYPGVPQFRSNLGNALAAAGDLQGAVAQHARAVAIQPALPQLRSNLGNALAAAGDVKGAIVEYDRALAVDPSFRDALINRAAARERAGDREGALRDLNEALVRDPGDADAWVDRGGVLGRMGDYRAAERSFWRALAASPGHPGALVGRGVARIALGDRNGARADWREALGHEESRDEAHALLAEAGL